MSDATSGSFIPANRLESMLVEAANDPGKRPAFYRELLGSRVLVLGSSSEPPSDSGMLRAGSTVSIQHWQGEDGEKAIPIFTSLERLQAAIAGEESYLQMAARDLFGMVSDGSGYIMNPRSAYGKLFTPAEVASLLDGSIFEQIKTNVVQESQQVLLGQPAPAIYPHKLVAALTSLFAEHPEVRKAYLALMHMPASGQPAHPVVGIDVDGDFSAVLQDAGVLLNDVTEKGQVVDFVQIKPGETIPDYMTGSVEPFYVKP